MSYLEKFDVVYEHQKKKLERKQTKYKKTGLPSNPINFYSFLSGTLETIAIGDFILHKDINSFKNNLYNACQAYIKAVEFYDRNGIEESKSFMSMVSYRELLRAIASDSVEATNKIAHLMGDRGEVDAADIDKFTYHWGYALKYIVLDRYKDALNHLDKIKDKKRNMFADYLRSIIEGDKTGALSNIELIISQQKNSKATKGTPHELLSITVIALVKLALLKGIDITVNDKIAPLELIVKTEVDYILNKILLISVGKPDRF
ncbi:hypothetical protein [Abyssisolibacter fermentans]|uniref:hypothetical protein n=1 Tax=Abyssisolibacter fermentans TaxID=1766203 RepID=UPI00083651FE|nr:hypothetical protein [Abyssisolibacter fermentans]